MRRWLAKSLKRKLTLLLVFAILVPMLITGIVSYRIAASVTEEKAKQSGMNTLKQVKDKLEFVIQDVENMSIFLIGEKDIQLYLDNKTEDVTRYSLIIGTLTNLAFSKKYISNITIKPLDGKPELSNSTILESGLPPLLEQFKMDYRKTSKWLTSLYTNYTNEGVKQVVSIVRPIRNFYNFREIGWISVSLDQKVELLTCMTLPDKERLIVVLREEAGAPDEASLAREMKRIGQILKCETFAALGRSVGGCEQLSASFAEADRIYSFKGLIGSSGLFSSEHWLPSEFL